jgi:hypothetical protein
MPDTDETEQPRFCSDCGCSLVKLKSWCTSEQCNKCGKEIFIRRLGDEGKWLVKKGDLIHIPDDFSISFSLDPKTGVFTRHGLEGFLKQLFLEEDISTDNLIEKYKARELLLDKELESLDCIQHCDLQTPDGVGKAIKILKSEGLTTHLYFLHRSCILRECYTSIEKGDALEAAFASHLAGLLKAYSILESYHFKEIFWLGYECYVELCKNEESKPEMVKEQRLIKSVMPKITSMETEVLYAIANDGKIMGPRLGVSGIEECTLKALLTHELDRRTKDKDEFYKNKEISIKEKDNRIKVWGFFFLFANAVVIAYFKYG